MSISKKTFGHDLKAVAVALKNIENHLWITENAMKGCRDNIAHCKSVLDEIYSNIEPLLDD